MEARIQRGLAMRLHNARQMRRAPHQLSEVRDHGKTVIERIGVAGKANGWHVTGKKQDQQGVGDSTVPFAKQAIAAVIANTDPADATGDAGLLWWYYSGVSHGTPYALMQNVDRDKGVPTGVTGVMQSPIFTSGPQIVAAASWLASAALNLGQAHAQLIGLDTSDLDEACSQVTGFVSSIVLQVR